MPIGFFPGAPIIASNPLPVRAASHAKIRLAAAAPRNAELGINHLNDAGLLARECRPLATGADVLEIKTHPEATHVSCSLSAAGRPTMDTQFSVCCGESLAPIARYFIVIGAMKCGTTTLFQMLSRHPALCQTWAEVPGVSFRKEINYFQSLYKKGDSPIDYDWRFPFEPTKHAWTLDVSPNYAKLPKTKSVPERIAELGGEVKLAYILREPVDRIESQVAHRMGEGGEVKNLRHSTRLSCYAQHLDGFVEKIPRDDILLLDFEQLRRNHRATLAQVCDFLDIDRFHTKARVHNKRKVKYSFSAPERAELAEALRPDVQRLISEYGFEPARKWLRARKRRWFNLPALRR